LQRSFVIGAPHHFTLLGIGLRHRHQGTAIESTQPAVISRVSATTPKLTRAFIPVQRPLSTRSWTNLPQVANACTQPR
jgi:hypothetical protein